jgi:uncharacterized protein (TIGR02231 family)
MKKNILKQGLSVFLLAPFIVPSFLCAAPIKVDSRIEAVTVYADRAAVTRSAEVNLPAGASTLEFEGLPVSIITDALRAQGSSLVGVAVTLGSVDSKIISSTEITAPRVRELNAALQDLMDKRAEAATQEGALSSKKKFLEALGQQAATVSNDNFTHLDLHADQWLAAGTALLNGTSEVLKAEAALAVSLRGMDQKITALREELQQLQAVGRGSLKVSIPVETKANTQFKIKLTYQIPSATWQPIYDARLDTASAKVALTQFGEVRQATGEEWKDVELTLSTATPARGAQPPSLRPAWISLYDARQPSGGYAAMQSAMDGAQAKSDFPTMKSTASMNAPPALALPEPPAYIEATFQAATINAGGYVSEYKIPGNNDVPADNSKRKMLIGQLESTSSLSVQVRPALTREAYLIAKTKVTGDAPLLAGRASLFRDGVFIGSNDVPLLRSGEEVSLSFGVDDQVVVKRQVLADSNGSKGLIARDKTLERKIITRVENLHRFPVVAEVLEALPIAQDERIQVNLLEADTTQGYAKDHDGMTGLAKWPLNLAAGGKGEVKLGWKITWPENMQLNGL